MKALRTDRTADMTDRQIEVGRQTASFPAAWTQHSDIFTHSRSCSPERRGAAHLKQAALMYTQAQFFAGMLCALNCPCADFVFAEL